MTDLKNLHRKQINGFNLEHASWFARLSDELKNDCISDIKEIIEQIRREDREMLAEKVKKLKNSRILSIISSSAGKRKTEGYHKAINEVLSIIKPQNDVRVTE